MSRIEPKAGEWLRQQIEELGTLRTASVRDPQFKAWRQNTLTFIQRIWPGEQPRSERFRRIPFSPPSTRADARAIREQFERGCGEALEYLNALLVELGAEPVKPGTTRRSAASAAGDDAPVAETPDESRDARDYSEGVIGDGPLLDLLDSRTSPPERSTGPSRLPSSGMSRGLPDGLPEEYAGSTPLDLPPAGSPRATPERAEPPKPAPPRESSAGRAEAPPDAPSSKISVRGSEAAPGPRPARPNPLKDILASHRKGEPVERGPRSGRPKKGGKGRLKDMLGLANLGRPESATPAPKPAAANPGPRPAPPVVKPVEAESPSPAPDDLEPTRAAADRDADAAEELTEISAADLVEDPEAGEGARPAGDDDSSHSWKVTEDFLRNSPVLSSAARPVTRRPRTASGEPMEPIPSRDSAASRILAIAAEVDSLGVPDGHRARARAALMDLARQLDEPEISWDMLRDAVHFVMEFPPIARRALPVLLPFLDLAA